MDRPSTEGTPMDQHLLARLSKLARLDLTRLPGMDGRPPPPTPKPLLQGREGPPPSPTLQTLLSKLPQAGPMTAPHPGPTAPGRWLSHSYADSAGQRDYRLYVPTGHTGEPVP